MGFLSFSPDYWDGPRHNRHYFLEELGRRSRVLFVSPPFYIVRLIQQLGRQPLYPSGVRELSPGLVSYTPSKLLFTNHRVPWLNRGMRSMRHRRIRRVMRRYGVNEPVLLIWHPQYTDMIGQFRESLVVYYAYDQYSGYTGGNARTGQDEIALMERADLVFVLSRELYEEKRKYISSPSKLFHLANAVDFSRFSASRSPSTLVPADLQAIPPPRIGYIGTVNEKVDLRIVEHIATARPQWSVVIIGRENYRVAEQKRLFQQLTARPNVHWLGYRDPDQVPAYLKGLDVCLMCYVINSWTRYGDPSKLHEYLASGKPTIGSGLASIREYADVVDIPEDPVDWIPAIERSLCDRSEDAVRRRVETARQNSYESRVDRFLDVVNARLSEKS